MTHRGTLCASSRTLSEETRTLCVSLRTLIERM
jgi:hypothetical protein